VRGVAFGYLQLIHPAPVFFVLLGTALFGLLAAGGRPDPARYALMLIAMLGGQIAIGAHNEWRDRKHDARHQPEKPIPAGLVDAGVVRPIIVVGLLVGIVAAAALGFWSLVLYTLGTGSGFAYNVWFKRTPLSGVPYLVGLPLLPIWATLVMDGFEPRLLWLYPLGGAFVVAVHLAQSLADIAGDRAAGTRGLAVVLGRRRTLEVIWTLAFGTALVMPLGAIAIGEEPAFAFVAAALTAGLFAAFLKESRGHERGLFATLCAGATILAAGWILSLAG
jgi:4-hydroxybenzoate polyprenyltransferase